MADTGLNQTWPGTAGDAGAGQEVNWWVDAFSDDMYHLAQQKFSKFRSCVRNKTITGNSTFFERLAAEDATPKTSRHQATPLLDGDHSRRKVSMEDWQWGDLVDPEDVRRMLVDPVGAYTKNAGMALARKWDDLIIGSDGAATPAISGGMAGDALDGTGTTVSFDTTNQQIASGTANMTIAKMRSAKYILDSNDVDEMDRYMALSPKAIDDLLGTAEVTSSDYNTVKALVQGEIDTFLGFKIIKTTRLPLLTGERVCLAWHKDAVGLATCSDMKIRKDERPDLSYALQVYAEFTANATRIDDAGVVRILNTET